MVTTITTTTVAASVDAAATAPTATFPTTVKVPYNLVQNPFASSTPLSHWTVPSHISSGVTHFPSQYTSESKQLPAPVSSD